MDIIESKTWVEWLITIGKFAFCFVPVLYILLLIPMERRGLYARPSGSEPFLYQDSLFRKDPFAGIRTEHVRRHQAVLQGNVCSQGRE